jgi:integrase
MRPRTPKSGSHSLEGPSKTQPMCGQGRSGEPPPSRIARKLRLGVRDMMHGCRHLYASVQLEEGTSVRALADYLGHSDPGSR